MRLLAPKIENHLKTGVVFYCKDCEKIVTVSPVGRKFVYRCNICKTKNVAFGSPKSIKNFYRLPDEILALPEEAPAAEVQVTAPAAAGFVAAKAAAPAAQPVQPVQPAQPATPEKAPEQAVK